MKKPIRKKAVALFLSLIMIIAAVPLVMAAFSGDKGITDINNSGISVHFINTSVSDTGYERPTAYGIDKGNSNTYKIRILNHSDKTPTITKINNSNYLTDLGDRWTPPCEFAHGNGAKLAFTINKSALTEGQVYDFSVSYTLDGVYDSDGVTLKTFVTPAYIGVYDSSNDSKFANYSTGSNVGFTMYGENSSGRRFDLDNRFETTKGILEKKPGNTISTNRSWNVSGMEYNYYIDTTDLTYKTWQGLGFRLYAYKWGEERNTFQETGQQLGTIRLQGDWDKTNSNVTLTMADEIWNWTEYNGDNSWLPAADRPWLSSSTGYTVQPHWDGQFSYNWSTLYNANDRGYFRFAGNLLKGSSTSRNPADMFFDRMFWRNPNNPVAYAEFSAHIYLYVFDKTELRDYVRSVSGENFAPLSGRYSTAVWNEYTTALKNAYIQLAAEKTNQYDVNLAKTNLQTAVNKLKSYSNLSTQFMQITHKLHSTDKASSATSTDTRLILAPIGSYTVPYLSTMKNASGVNKCTAPIKKNYTTSDITINDAGTYDYWKIDFSQVNPTLTSAAALIDREWCYTDAFKTGFTTARNNLKNVDQTSYTATPEKQSDVDNLVTALKEYIDNEDLEVNHSHVNGELQIDTGATCDAAGVGHYSCTYCTKTTQSNVEISQTAHAYGNPTYSWSEDNSKCTARRVCTNFASHVDEQTVNTTHSTTKPADCEEDGTETYTATFREGLGSDTKDVTITHSGHAYGKVDYIWSEDNSKCTATRVCANNADHVDTETKATTLTTTDADCTTAGNKHYTVTFRTGLGSTEKNISIDPLGHDQPAAYTPAKAATCMKEGNIEYWHCSKCDKNYSDADCKTEVKNVTTAIDPDNHNYGKVEYSWSIAGPDDDTATCEAIRTCSYNGTHNLIQKVDATHTTTTEPGCETKGIETFTATFTTPGLEGTTTREVDIDPLQHDWIVNEETDENGWKITKAATCGETGSKERVCSRDSSHKQTETIPATNAHIWNTEFTVDLEPNCGEGKDGSKSKHCSVCDKAKTEVTAIPWAHTMDDYEYLSGQTPRFLNDGFGWEKCSVCGYFSGAPADMISVPHMIDHVAPTAKMFLNGNEAGTDTLYIKNENDSVEVTVGEFFDACDAEGNYGAGVQAVYYHVSNTELTEEQLKALGNDAWTSFYDGGLDDTGSGNNPIRKNVDLVLDFDEGATKYVYLKLVDHYDPQSGAEQGWGGNKAYIASPAITFDSLAPEVTVAGEGKDNKFCGETTVTVTDATALTVTLDGTEVTLSDEGIFEVSAVGEHTVVATDAAGNETTEIFTVAANHSWDEYVPADNEHKASDADCTNRATYYKVCSNCGLYSNTETFPYGDVSSTHDWDDPTYAWSEDGKTCTATRVCKKNAGHTETETATVENGKINIEEGTPATCTEDGTNAHTATFENTAFTGSSKVVTVPASGHDTNPAHIPEKAATCTAEGNVEYWQCSKCGKNFNSASCTTEIENVATEIDPDNHNYSNDISYVWTDNNATCTATRVCTRDAEHKDTEIATIANGKVKEKTDIPATCTTKGKKSYTATFANSAFAKQVKEVETPVLGHVTDLDHHEKVDATCSATGTVEYWYCSRCKKNFADATCTRVLEDAELVIQIDADNHNYGRADYHWTGDHSACTAVKVCEHNAEHKLTAEAKVTSTVQTVSSCIAKGVTVYTATFTEEGFDTQTETVTDTEFGSHGEAVLLTEENYDTYKDLPKFDAANTKAYKAATDEAEGYSGDEICPICGEILKTGAVTPPLKECEHPEDQLGDWVILVEPTCVHTGSKAKFCKKCKSYVTPYVDIPKTEHKITAWTVVKDATCGEEGLEKAVCQNEDCKKEITRPIAKLTHNFSEWTVDERATCQKVGKEVRVCDRCGATESRTIPVTADHYYVPVPAVEPTCTKPGLTAGWKCYDCGIWWIKQETVPATGHIDADKDGSCDVCGEAYQPDVVAPGDCKCICHKDSKIMQFLYKLVLPIWKLFKINNSCSCGHVHY